MSASSASLKRGDSHSSQAEVHRDYASCMAGCKNDPKADEYCLMADITTPVSYGGNIK